MDAAPAPETPDLSSQTVATSEGLPDSDAGAAAPPAPPTVEIHGKKVLLSVLVTYYDPECPDKCEEGSVKVGRPLPRGFKGVIFVRELCPCTVRRFAAANPPPAGEIPAPVLGRRARAALAGAAAPAVHREERGSKRLAVLEAEIEREQRALEGLRSGIAARVAPISEALEALAGEEAAAARAHLEAEGARKCLGQELEQLRARLSGLQAELHQVEERIAGAALERGSFARRRADLDEQLVAARARIAPAEAAAEKRLEKLRRRVATVRAYHPTLPTPPAPPGAAAEGARG